MRGYNAGTNPTTSPWSEVWDLTVDTQVALPECVLIVVEDVQMSADGYLDVFIRNSNEISAGLTNTDLSWQLPTNPDAYIDFMQLNTDMYYPGNSSTSPLNVDSSSSLPALPGGDFSSKWTADFDQVTPGAIYGLFRVDYTFEFDDMVCNVLAELMLPTPTPPAVEDTRTPTPTPTRTPTITRTTTVIPTWTTTATTTPTATVMPDCSLITVEDVYLANWGFFEVYIRNENDSDAGLTHTVLSWQPQINPDTFVDYMQLGADMYYNGDAAIPPLEVDSSADPPVLNGAGSVTLWRADFDGGNSTFMTGDFQVDFTFEFEGGPTCQVPVALAIATLTPSPTPDCNSFTLENVEIMTGNQFRAQVQNDSNQDAYYTHIEIDWQFVQEYMAAIGYSDMLVDWVKLNGTKLPGGADIHDYNSPTEIDGAWLFPIYSTSIIDVDFDWSGEVSDAFSVFGIQATDLGWRFELDNGCVIDVPRIERPLETPTPPAPPSCDNLSVNDVRWNGDDWEVHLHNTDYSPAVLVEQTLTWPAEANPEMYSNYSALNSLQYNTANVYSSPIIYTNLDPALRILPGLDVWWENDFNSAPTDYPPGYWSGEFIFEYPNGLQCTLFVEDDRPPCPEGGSGLRGEYYGDTTFTDLNMVRVDPGVDFDWGIGSPDAVLPSDTFSVRWTGQVEPQDSGTYTFTTRTDAGVRLWVNGVLLIDEWHDQSPTYYSGQIELERCQLYDIEMEYFENYGPALAELHWESANQSLEIIPPEDLYPATGPLPPTVTPMP
ncbi:MAG: hypothetical protein JXB38_14215 [Anaerolineales bacterium]|nr:hypothetical protein [Anaerolineales bacterium]